LPEPIVGSLLVSENTRRRLDCIDLIRTQTERL